LQINPLSLIKLPLPRLQKKHKTQLPMAMSFKTNKKKTKNKSELQICNHADLNVCMLYPYPHGKCIFIWPPQKSSIRSFSLRSPNFLCSLPSQWAICSFCCQLSQAPCQSFLPINIYTHTILYKNPIE